MNYIKSLIYCLIISWKSSRVCFLFRGIASVFAAIIPFLTIYLSKHIVDGVMEKKHSDIILLLMLLMFTNIFNDLINDFLMYMKDLHDDRLKNMVETRIMERALDIDVAKFDSTVFPDLLQAASNNSYTLINAIWNVFRLLSVSVSFTIALASAAAYNIVFVLVIFLVMLPSVFVDQKYAKEIHDFYLQNIINERKKYHYQNMALERQWARDVRLYDLKKFILTRYSNLWKLIYNQKKRLLRNQFFANSIVGLLPEVVMFLLSLLIILDVKNGKITIGDYIFIMGIFSTLCTSLYAVISANVTIYKDRLNIEILSKFEEFQNNIQDSGIEILDSDKIEIEFKNVSFSYPNCDNEVLHKVSFKINSGEKVCLVGINGSGKSTIIKLLLRYYNVTDGEILINGMAIEKYTLQSLKNSVSILFQDITLYPFDLKENIVIADIDRANNQEEAAIISLKRAGAYHLLNKLPYGVNTYIHKIFSDEGYEPSGGEAQQIGLARSIYRSRALLILDEPSSDLDPESEANMMKNIINMWQNKTVIFTSHRMSIVNLANRIIVIEDGRIIENGQHEQLINSNGRYAELYHTQANNYK